MIALALPVDCQIGRTCFVQSYPDDDAGPGAKDYACHGRTYQGHDGTDFRLTSMAAQRIGVAVRAAAAGTVLRIRDGVDDVSVRRRPVQDGQDCGNGLVVDHGGGWQTQYCHMAKGSIAVRPGQQVAAGAKLGLVGLSGNTEFPHLHLTVRQDGKPVDPFAYGAKPGACAAGRSLWTQTPAYVRGAVLQAGFAPGPVTMDQAQGGGVAGPTRQSPALVAWVQAIGLEAGDVRRLTLVAPDGSIVADGTEPPLDRDKAQVIQFAGRKMRGPGWTPGTYRARFIVTRASRPVIDRRFEVTL
jgi:murein DD-endopeptidase MepM/ murein hydrolase activator NlpD